MKVVKLGKYFGVQSKYSDSLPASVDCQKDSESTGENGTQVKPVLLAVEIFAVWGSINYMVNRTHFYFNVSLLLLIKLA